MARKKAAPTGVVLTCGWCTSGMHERCAKPRHSLPCDCFDHNHKEA